jgi:hypothetical protein
VKATYTRQALAELRAKDAARRHARHAAVRASDDEVERAIQRFRGGRGPVCPVDGPRPEPTRSSAPRAAAISPVLPALRRRLPRPRAALLRQLRRALAATETAGARGR